MNPMNPFLQILMGTLGTFGFNILFNIRGRKLALATIGGLIAWSVFLALEPVLPSEALRYFIAAATITAYSELLARLVKTPSTTFLVPAIIPLVPGSALYYTMNFALNEQWPQFAEKAFYTLQLALSLAVGIIAVTTSVRLVSAFLKKAHHHSI